MSIAKAISVRRAAKKDTIEDRSVTVTWFEKDSTKATNVTTVATGWMARPRVQDEAISTVFFVFVGSKMVTVYACFDGPQMRCPLSAS